MLRRLHGQRLKRSNERLLAQYGNLAKYIAGRYARSFRLSREQAEDLTQTLLAAIFRAPASYRNPKGISVILRTKGSNAIRQIIKSEPEIRMGLLRGGEGLKTLEEPPGLEPHLNGHGDLGTALRFFDRLSSPERVVLSMSFGLDGFEEFRDDAIVRRLGKSKSWVSMKRRQALFKLQDFMKVPNSTDGL